MEYLDIIDENGKIIAKEDRKTVHKNGLKHHASGIVILDKSGGGFLSQQRAYNKDKNPGLFDISASGHVPAGQNVLKSLLREIKEELGIEIDIKQIKLFDKYWRRETFNNGRFIENELDYIYITQAHIDLSKITIQEEEVEQVILLSAEQLKEKMANNEMVRRPFWNKLIELLNQNSDTKEK